MTTTVTESNQVTIPPEIAREFHIHPRTQLEWTKTHEGMILVKPLASRGELALQLMGAGRRWLRPGVDPIGELMEERAEDERFDCADQGSPRLSEPAGPDSA